MGGSCLPAGRHGEQNPKAEQVKKENLIHVLDNAFDRVGLKGLALLFDDQPSCQMLKSTEVRYRIQAAESAVAGSILKWKFCIEDVATDRKRYELQDISADRPKPLLVVFFDQHES